MSETMKTTPLEDSAHRLHLAAADMLGRIRDDSAAARRYNDFIVRRAAFAAFEADRDDLRAGSKRADSVFYTFFLAATFLSPVFVVWLAPHGDRAVAWDIFGVGSTFALLMYTYGYYTSTMVYQLFSGVASVLGGIFMAGADPTSPEAVEDKGQDSKGAHFAVTNLALLAVALLVSYCAWMKILLLYDLTTSGAIDHAAYNGVYVWFFFWVFVLSALFIVMDLHVARTDRSHSETFVASSSAVHATIPMFIGIFIMGLYMLVEYLEARYQLGADHSTAMKALSIDFVSGALSFQMIMSNVLFILIKQNFLLKTAYVTIDTSEDK